MPGVPKLPDLKLDELLRARRLLWEDDAHALSQLAPRVFMFELNGQLVHAAHDSLQAGLVAALGDEQRFAIIFHMGRDFRGIELEVLKARELDKTPTVFAVVSDRPVVRLAVQIASTVGPLRQARVGRFRELEAAVAFVREEFGGF